MTLIFDEQTRIAINGVGRTVQGRALIDIDFKESTVVHLTSEELDIFISALQIVRGGVR